MQIITLQQINHRLRKFVRFQFVQLVVKTMKLSWFQTLKVLRHLVITLLKSDAVRSHAIFFCNSHIRTVFHEVFAHLKINVSRCYTEWCRLKRINRISRVIVYIDAIFYKKLNNIVISLVEAISKSCSAMLLNCMTEFID